MKTSKVDAVAAPRPPTAGYYLHISEPAFVGGNVDYHIVQVTETPASGRACKHLKMGGSAACGWKAWEGSWTSLTRERARQLIVEAFKDKFGIDNYGYGLTEKGIVVYHYDAVNPNLFPDLDCDIPVEHQYMGRIKAQ